MLRGLVLLAAVMFAVPCSAETLRVAIPQKGNWDTSIVEFGVKQGFFKQEGLDIDTIYTQGGAPTLQAVISGSVDIGMASGLLGVVGAYAKGAPVRVISAEATGAPDLFWYAKSASGIKSLADTAGKTIAYSEPGSSTDLVLQALLAEAHVSGAKPVAAGGVPGVLTQVMSGQIDVGWSVPPANLQAVQDGTLVIVARGNDVPAIRDETIRVNFVNARALQSKHDAMEKFARAYVKSLNWAYSGDPKAIEYFAAGMNVPVPLAQTARDQFYPKDSMQPFEVKGQELMLKQALAYKFIPHAMSPADIKGLFEILGKDGS
jgi:NitT/TauT family transport system substrate-binding protein